VSQPAHPPRARFDPASFTRPDPSLLRYYTVVALLTGPFFPLTFLPLYFRFKTLEYRFDDDGVSMKWGMLFRREINLTYRRIQDINLSRGVVQRHFGLANIQLQTASGSAGAEMTIEGVRDPEALRDWLYSRMRGASDDVETAEASPQADEGDETLALLHEIRDLLREAAAGRGAQS
jgi:putative membrane protein